MKLKKIIILALVVIVSFTLLTTLYGCDYVNAEQEIAKAQNELVAQANDAVGMPNISNFTDKKLAKDILELRDQADLVTYAYSKNDMSGKFVFLGSSIGFGLPYSVQYTNPQTVRRLAAYSEGLGNDYLVPQADPNGLYMPEGLAATWVVMIDETTGDRYIMYFESDLTVSQNKLPRRLCEDWSLPLDY